MTTPDALTVLRDILDSIEELERLAEDDGRHSRSAGIHQCYALVEGRIARLEREQAEAKYPPLKPRSGR